MKRGCRLTAFFFHFSLAQNGSLSYLEYVCELIVLIMIRVCFRINTIDYSSYKNINRNMPF